MCAQDHPKFQSIADEAPLLYSRELQMGTEKKPHPMKLGEAVQKGIIGSQTLAYFIGRTYLFMKKIGMDPQRLRFRQHLQNEMAHYASDCWDAEAECSYGWIECAGLSDRSAFDLKVCTVTPPPTPPAQQRHCCVQLHHGATEVRLHCMTSNRFQCLACLHRHVAKGDWLACSSKCMMQ